MTDEKRIRTVRDIFKNIGITHAHKATDMKKIALLLSEAGIPENRVAVAGNAFSVARFSNLKEDELTTLLDISKNNWPPTGRTPAQTQTSLTAG